MNRRRSRVLSLIAILAALSSSGAFAQYCERAELLPNQPRPDEKFGASVAADGVVAVVGAPSELSRPDNGRVVIFRRVGEDWIQDTVVTGLGDGASDDFGHVVAVLGDTILIGAPAYDGGRVPGRAYVFRNVGGVWGQEAILTASDGSADDHFGWSLALGENEALIGAPGRDGSRGAVYQFERNGSNWSEGQRLDLGAVGQAGDQFGFRVRMDGDRLGVSAPFRMVDALLMAGSIVLYVREIGGWSPQAAILGDGFMDQLGWNFDLEGDLLATSTNDEDQLRLHLYREMSPGQWKLEARVAKIEFWMSQFPHSIIVHGQRIFAGDPWSNQDLHGAVHVFENRSGEWGHAASLRPANPVLGSRMGQDLALTDGSLLVGSYGEKSYHRLADDHRATRASYGKGWPGTQGVPTLALDRPPWVGSTPTLQISNSRGARTIALLAIGLGDASIDTRLGGTLLVSPSFLRLISIAAPGTELEWPLSCELADSGVSVFFQALLADPGASHGVAFTRGLAVQTGTH